MIDHRHDRYSIDENFMEFHDDTGVPVYGSL